MSATRSKKRARGAAVAAEPVPEATTEAVSEEQIAGDEVEADNETAETSSVEERAIAQTQHEDEAPSDEDETPAETDRTLHRVSDVAPASGSDTAPALRGGASLMPEIDRERIKQALEALIFVSERIVTPAQLARGVKVRAAQVRELVAELMAEYTGRGIELIEVANGYQFRSAHACADYVREFVAQKPVRLTRAQLETLALIAYRQPITRPEIDEVRGVDSGSAMRVLLERNLIKMLGRKDEPGRPLLYGSSAFFLEFFGMRSLKDLPTLREFTDLSDENRALFKRKTGENVEDAEAELAAAEEAARLEDDQSAHISDEDLAQLAAEADVVEDADLSIPPAAAGPETGGTPPQLDELAAADRKDESMGPGDDEDEEEDLDDDDEDDDFDDEDDEA
jgi:segregation and condensation protein B